MITKPVRHGADYAGLGIMHGSVEGLSGQAVAGRRDSYESVPYEREKWESGITRAVYGSFILSRPVMAREALYADVLRDVQAGNLSAKSLLPFITFEPHHRLVSDAVEDYLICRHCDIEDEFAGVNELIAIVLNDGASNRGALLAGLVAVGDRRVNAVARSARHLLTASEIKSFSRVQPTELRSAYVEFCLDWLVELKQNYCKEFVDDIACAMQLMVIHDESGIVVDLSDVELVGFRQSSAAKTMTFESYYSHIRPLLCNLQTCPGFEVVVGKIVEMWDLHTTRAYFLRSD